MLYLVVDPKFLYIPDIDSISIEEIQLFVFRLLQWGDILKTYNVAFGITERCQDALKAMARSAFDKKSLAKLTRRIPALESDEVLRAFMPLVNELMKESYMDQLIKRTKTEDFEWDVVAEKILVSPKDYVDRLVNDELQNSFMEMLASIVYARQNQVVPLSEFQNLMVLSTYDKDEIEWALSTDYKLLVRVDVEVAADKSVKNWQSVQNDTRFFQELQTVQFPKEIEGVMTMKRDIKSVSTALNEAINDFPKRLINSRLARRTAASCDYEKPAEIYNLLRGLVTVWLAVYESDGEVAAGETFYNEFQYQYIPSESTTVSRDPRLKRDYIATVDGVDYFCGKHIRIGTGPRCVRINFALRTVEGQTQIILGRVGRHGANTMNR